MNYRNEWINSCFGNSNAETITVYFKDGREPATYSETMFDLLKTDNLVKWITSDTTGEILFESGL